MQRAAVWKKPESLCSPLSHPSAAERARKLVLFLFKTQIWSGHSHCLKPVSSSHSSQDKDNSLQGLLGAGSVPTLSFLHASLLCSNTLMLCAFFSLLLALCTCHVSSTIGRASSSASFSSQLKVSSSALTSWLPNLLQVLGAPDVSSHLWSQIYIYLCDWLSFYSVFPTTTAAVETRRPEST